MSRRRPTPFRAFAPPAGCPFPGLVPIGALALALAGCGPGNAPDDPLPAFADAFAGSAPAAEATAGAAIAVIGAPSPDIAPDAALADAGAPDAAARTVTALEHLGAHALVDVARRLETGIPLDDVRRGCLGAHDPALGAPLAALDCTEPVAVADTPVAVRTVSLEPDETCLATLGDASRSAADVVAACDWRAASLRLGVEWVPPPPGKTYAGTPRPSTGVSFDYASDPATLVATNLESRLDGSFTCVADLGSGSLVGDTDCTAGMAGFADRLEAFAARLRDGASN